MTNRQAGTIADPALLFGGSENAATGITAGTTRTQAGAFGLVAEFSKVDTSTAPATGTTLGDGVRLPAAVAPSTFYIHNNTGFPVQVYGTNTDTINGVAGATGLPMCPKSVEMYVCFTNGQWVADLGFGYSGPQMTELSCDAMTASATQTQAAGTLVVAPISRFVTVASAGNAATLPASAPGLTMTVINAHATNAINVFPSAGGTGTETINALSANAAFSLAATKVVTFYCTVAGTWHTQLGG